MAALSPMMIISILILAAIAVAGTFAAKWLSKSPPESVSRPSDAEDEARKKRREAQQEAEKRREEEEQAKQARLDADQPKIDRWRNPHVFRGILWAIFLLALLGVAFVVWLGLHEGRLNQNDDRLLRQDGRINLLESRPLTSPPAQVMPAPAPQVQEAPLPPVTTPAPATAAPQQSTPRVVLPPTNQPAVTKAPAKPKPKAITADASRHHREATPPRRSYHQPVAEPSAPLPITPPAPTTAELARTVADLRPGECLCKDKLGAVTHTEAPPCYTKDCGMH